VVTSQAFSQSTSVVEPSLFYENASITLKEKDFSQFEQILLAEVGSAKGTSLQSKGRPFAFKVDSTQLDAFLAKVEVLGTSVERSRNRYDLMLDMHAIENQQRRLLELKARLPASRARSPR
jgi:environmental stress-induced protein Ves